MIICLGIPLDENSSFLKGAAEAPEKIRAAYASDSANTYAEDGTNLSAANVWRDVGDLVLSAMPDAFDQIERRILSNVQSDNKVISLGGDHSITYPIIKAFAQKYDDLNILHIDAHGDLYDEFEGSRFSHACPFARIMEENLASRLVQIGIRTLTTHQRQQATRFNVETIEMKDWSDDLILTFEGPVYISLDLDALDPAFVPGVSHYEPGGFTTRQVLNVIQKLNAEVVGADIVELNPSRDIQHMTAMVAAKLLKELICKMR
jgi:arginase